MKKAITLGILVSAVLMHGTAFGQAQDKAQQKCINTLNKGMVKVASAQNKANGKCASDFAKGKNMDADACWNMATKVDTAATKNCSAEMSKCTTVPDFGKTSCGTVNNYAEYNAGEFASDVFGETDPSAGITLCATDKVACKCQAKALKASNKLYATYMKVYNKCKKAALKSGIIDVTGLDTCTSDDAKMKIAKAATKLGGTITKSCAAVTIPFPAIDSSCSGLNGAPLAGCLEDRVRCAVCITEVASDNLTIDCDLYDDGNSENGSCFDDF